MNILTVMEMYPTHQACIEHLERVRWADEPHCPYCGSINVARKKERGRIGRSNCHDCYSSFNVLRKTVMQGTRLPLQNWFVGLGTRAVVRMPKGRRLGGIRADLRRPVRRGHPADAQRCRWASPSKPATKACGWSAQLNRWRRASATPDDRMRTDIGTHPGTCRTGDHMSPLCFLRAWARIGAKVIKTDLSRCRQAVPGRAPASAATRSVLIALLPRRSTGMYRLH